MRICQRENHFAQLTELMIESEKMVLVCISSVYIIKALSHNEDLTEINSSLITGNILNIYICTLSSF